MAIAQSLLDELWDFSDPAGSEARLRQAAHDQTDAAARAELETQVARALGLQERYAEAHAILDGIDVSGDVVAARAALERGRLHNSAGDPERAESQQRYMKAAMPYRGLSSPQLTAVLRPLLAEHPPEDRDSWAATVRVLWDDAAYREERYAALALARHRAARPWLDAASVPLFRHLVVTGAWWDLVDDVATHLVGPALRAHRADLTPVLVAWATDEDLWLRRTAVICQVGARDGTDAGLLHHAVEANAEDPTFWLRKAVGWALRDYARTDPDWVRAEVDRLGDRLSGLSRREALKHL